MDLSEVEHNSKSGRGVGSYIFVMRSITCRSFSISPITTTIINIIDEEDQHVPAEGFLANPWESKAIIHQ